MIMMVSWLLTFESVAFYGAALILACVREKSEHQVIVIQTGNLKSGRSMFKAAGPVMSSLILMQRPHSPTRDRITARNHDLNRLGLTAVGYSYGLGKPLCKVPERLPLVVLTTYLRQPWT